MRLKTRLQLEQMSNTKLQQNRFTRTLHIKKTAVNQFSVYILDAFAGVGVRNIYLRVEERRLDTVVSTGYVLFIQRELYLHPITEIAVYTDRGTSGGR